ncbi:MAG: HYR domain-containing protein, partial [Paludibacter sp.]|nr:HYR domain-containing protein [Paludibacter sp.]
MRTFYFKNSKRVVGLRTLTLILLLALPVMVKAALAPFTLTVTPTAETCTGNGKLTWTITGQTAGSTMVYAIYKSPNYTTAISTQSTNTLTGLTAGSYRVIATQTLGGESNSQTKDATILNQKVTLVFNSTVVHEVCGNDAQITVNVTVGTGVTYELYTGPVTRPPQASNVFAGLTQGVYTVRVKDACGDITAQTAVINKYKSNFTISPPAIQQVLVDCNTIKVFHPIATVATGDVLLFPLQYKFTVHPPDGSPDVVLNYSYTYGTGGMYLHPSSLTAPTGGFQFNLPYWEDQPYSYDLEITDKCGNVFTRTNNLVNINQELRLYQRDAVCSQAFLQAEALTFTSPVTMELTAYPASYTGPTTLSVSSTTYAFWGSFGSATSPVPSGPYTVKVTDGCGNTITKTININNTVNPPNFYTIPGCGVGNASFYWYGPTAAVYATARITAAPASFPYPLPYDVTSMITANKNYVVIEDAPAGTYTIEIVDDCGIVRTNTKTVGGYNPGDYSNTTVTKLCGAFNIFMSNTGNNGVMTSYFLQKLNPATGQWGHPSTGVAYVTGQPNVANSISLNNNYLNGAFPYAGTFRIITAYRTATFSVPSYGNKWCIDVNREFTIDYDLTLDNVTGFHCPGGLKTDVGILATGGVPPLTYKITKKDGVPFVIDNGTDNLFTGLADGTYNFQVLDNCGNVLNQLYDITILSMPQITPISLCPGSNGQLAVNGVPYLNFQWWKEGTPGTILSTAYNLPFNNFNPATDAGTYYVHLTSPSGSSCIDRVLSFTVSASPSAPNAGADNTISVCQSSGGINLLDYLSAGADKYGSFADASANAVPGNVWYPNQHPAASYTFTYSVNGQCSGTDQSIITISTTDTQAPIINCPADVTVTVNSVGCKATGVVLGTPTVTDNCTATANIVVTNNAPASFPTGNTLVTWTATDASGNSATCQQTVTVTADVVSLAYTSSATTQCGGDPFTATFTPTPSTAQVTWTNSLGESGSGDVNQILSNTTVAPITVSYTVTATSPYGCANDTKTINVTVNPTPEIASSECQQTICSGETAVITFTTPVPTTINWTADDGTSGTGDISAVKINTGSTSITITYTINGVTASGCNAQPRTCQVIVNPAVVANITSQTNADCKGNTTGSVTVSATIGLAPFQYSVDGGTSQAQGTFSGLSVGSHTITVQDANGCIATVPVTIGTSCISIIKTGTVVDTNNDGVKGNAGDHINYTFTVSNTGSVTLTNVTVTDPKVTVSGGPLSSLLAGAVDNSTFTAAYVITAADVTAGSVSNQATASGKDPNNNTVSDLSDDLSNTGDNPTITPVAGGSISIIKTGTVVDTNGDGVKGNAGDHINYTFTVS